MAGFVYPETRMLILRPCQKALCMNIRPAASLLSVLSYYYQGSAEGKLEGTPQQTSTFSIQVTNDLLLYHMVDDITERTLHDVAFPWLGILGYLTLSGPPRNFVYTLHLDRIRQGLIAYGKDIRNKTVIHVEAFFKSILPELEKFLKGPITQLEKFPIELEKFREELEKFLKDRGKISKSPRGRKPASEEHLRGKFLPPRKREEKEERKKEKEGETVASGFQPEGSSLADTSLSHMLQEQERQCISSPLCFTTPVDTLAESALSDQQESDSTPQEQGKLSPIVDSLAPFFAQKCVPDVDIAQNDREPMPSEQETLLRTLLDDLPIFTPTLPDFDCRAIKTSSDVSAEKIGKGNTAFQPPDPEARPIPPSPGMKWGPEKMVLLTAAERWVKERIPGTKEWRLVQGKNYGTRPMGKVEKQTGKALSEWDRQHLAARFIFKAIPDLGEEEFMTAYRLQNTWWWNNIKGSVTVEVLKHGTPRDPKGMRIIELLQDVAAGKQPVPFEPQETRVFSRKPAVVEQPSDLSDPKVQAKIEQLHPQEVNERNKAKMAQKYAELQRKEAEKKATQEKGNATFAYAAR